MLRTSVESTQMNCRRKQKWIFFGASGMFSAATNHLFTRWCNLFCEILLYLSCGRGDCCFVFRSIRLRMNGRKELNTSHIIIRTLKRLHDIFSPATSSPHEDIFARCSPLECHNVTFHKITNSAGEAQMGRELTTVFSYTLKISIHIFGDGMTKRCGAGMAGEKISRSSLNHTHNQYGETCV